MSAIERAFVRFYISRIEGVSQPDNDDVTRHETPTVILQSRITCPACGFAKGETMQTDACQYFYTCEGCGTRLTPKDGDCCVFCSYGDVPCPPMQSSDDACCESALYAFYRVKLGHTLH